MVVTDNFIYIHIPKTGGTFVTHVLDKLHNGTIRRKLTRIFFRKRYLNLLKHGTCSDIPLDYINLPVVSTIRNPYDRYVSQYEFKWWKMYPEDFAESHEWKKNCINFPDVTFEEFVLTANKVFFQFPEICRQRNIGFHTEQFILYYFKNPYEILKKIDSTYISSKHYRRDMYDIHFIYTEELNYGLYNYLLSSGYHRKEIAFILTTGKINPIEGGRTANQKWKYYYTDELKDFIREKERYLFAMFPEYDLL